LTFHFGLPPAGVIERAHEAGIAVGISATCLEEARRIEAAGADFVIAQGAEAGGHRGIFDVDGADDALSTFDLLATLVGTVRIPLVAAGGIMNGAHAAKALQAGAVAVQMGTAFLCCTESGATETHRRYLLQAQDRGTAQTLAWSGRPARSIKTEFMNLMNGKPTLPFPLQNSVTRAIRQAAGERRDGEYQSLWAGSNYSMCREGSTAEFMGALAREIDAARGPLK
jgi:nitronate monooxygenase